MNEFVGLSFRHECAPPLRSTRRMWVCPLCGTTWERRGATWRTNGGANPDSEAT